MPPYSKMASDMNDKNFFAKNVEQELFKILEHQTRRDIVRFIGEKKTPVFTDIAQAVKTVDSPTLSYHLRALGPFIEQQNGRYLLTSIGQDACNLLLKTAAYSELVLHMGMTMTEEEHQKWHAEHHEMTPEHHDVFTKRMGISEEEHREWHKTHEVPLSPVNTSKKKTINPFAVGGGFINYCVKQGWVIQEGKGRRVTYSVTTDGEENLKTFGIEP